MDNSDKSWEYFGKNDPYYGVIAQPEFHQQTLNEDAKARFFESGSHHIDRVLSVIHTHLVPEFIPSKAIDFGCGVGRLTIPLATVCDSVIAVDVSESMLKEAMTNCALKEISNVKFVQSDDQLAGVTETVDFINSFIVFQHIPPQRGEEIVRRLIDRLQEGGVGVLHFTYLRQASLPTQLRYWAINSVPLLNGLVNFLRRKKPFNYPTMQMHAYRLETLFRILQEKNCSRIYVEFSNHSDSRAAHYGLVLFFQKRSVAEHW